MTGDISTVLTVHFSVHSHSTGSDASVFFWFVSPACSDMLISQLMDYHSDLTGGGQGLLGLLCSISEGVMVHILPAHLP